MTVAKPVAVGERVGGEGLGVLVPVREVELDTVDVAWGVVLGVAVGCVAVVVRDREMDVVWEPEGENVDVGRWVCVLEGVALAVPVRVGPVEEAEADPVGVAVRDMVAVKEDWMDAVAVRVAATDPVAVGLLDAENVRVGTAEMDREAEGEMVGLEETVQVACGEQEAEREGLGLVEGLRVPDECEAVGAGGVAVALAVGDEVCVDTEALAVHEALEGVQEAVSVAEGGEWVRLQVVEEVSVGVRLTVTEPCVKDVAEALREALKDRLWALESVRLTVPVRLNVRVGTAVAVGELLPEGV